MLFQVVLGVMIDAHVLLQVTYWCSARQILIWDIRRHEAVDPFCASAGRVPEGPRGIEHDPTALENL